MASLGRAGERQRHAGAGVPARAHVWHYGLELAAALEGLGVRVTLPAWAGA